jgi:hypothetical protein
MPSPAAPDALLAAGCDVRHIMDGPRLEAHRLSAQARVEDGLPVYDVAEDRQGRIV